MPSLFDCASHFDDIAATDSYTGAALFKVQTSTFLGASPDGSTSQKRIVSAAPSLTIPTRRAITALAENYIIGLGILDGIYGRGIRKSYWAKLVTDSFTILTPGQAALGSAGTTAYGHKAYLKDTVNSATDAEYDPFWEIFFAPSEAVSKGSFFRVGSTLYRARSAHLDEAGFTNAASDELDAGAGVTVTFSQTGAYDPVADAYASDSVVTTGIMLDRYKLYDQLTAADQPAAAGDRTLIVASSAVTPVVGRNVTVSGRSWQVLSSTLEQDAWGLHVRRV